MKPALKIIPRPNPYITPPNTDDTNNCDVSNSKDNIEFIYNCDSLVEFIPPMNISNSMHVNANNLPAEVFVNVINNLATVEEPQILSIGSANINKVPDDVITTAISKNWSIA